MRHPLSSGHDTGSRVQVRAERSLGQNVHIVSSTERKEALYISTNLSEPVVLFDDQSFLALDSPETDIYRLHERLDPEHEYPPDRRRRIKRRFIITSDVIGDFCAILQYPADNATVRQSPGCSDCGKLCSDFSLESLLTP